MNKKIIRKKLEVIKKWLYINHKKITDTDFRFIEFEIKTIMEELDKDP